MDVILKQWCCSSDRLLLCRSDLIPLLLFCPQRLRMFTTNCLPFLLPSTLILYQYIHLLLCRSVRLFYSILLPVCLSVSPSVCGKCLRAAWLQPSCSRFSTADSSPGLISPGSEQRAATARPFQNVVFSRGRIMLTSRRPLCNYCDSIVAQEISG